MDVRMEEKVQTRERSHRASRESPDFGDFYRAQLSRVLGLTYSLTGNWSVAEDLAQEVFLRTYTRWHRVRTYDRPDAWVRRVTLNLVNSRFRRLSAEARAMARLRSRHPDTERGTMPWDSARFWDAVRTLPRRQAEAAALHYADDQSVSQIAVIMGCAEGTVKAHLHRARERLAQQLAADQGGMGQ